MWLKQRKVDTKVPQTSFMDRAKILIADMHRATDEQAANQCKETNNTECEHKSCTTFCKYKYPEPDKSDWLVNGVYDDQYADDYENNENPYEGASWGDNWFCIRCGNKLQEMKPESWKLMKQKQSLLYVCSNEKCFHHNAPLIVHHPFGTNSAPGDSYSISWIK